MVNKTQTARKPFFALDRNSPLGRFWRWWSGELVEMAPQWLLQSAGSVGNMLLVEVAQQGIVLRRWVQGKLTEQGRLDGSAGDQTGLDIAFQALAAKLRKRDDQVALWLADSQFLAKQVELPLAAAENLRQVLGFEMDRYTPFKADQVYFDFRVVQQDTQNNRLLVNLVAAPRAAVDAALEQLAKWGVPAHAVHVAGITVPGDDPIDLMPDERRITKTTVQHLVNLGLLAFVVVAAVSAIGIPIWQKRHLAVTLGPMVGQAKEQATATDALRRDWDKRSAEYNFVLEKKQAIPPLVVQLDELSRLLPDDTWVQQFDLKGKELQIQGETASSSKLVGLVESSKMLREASFRSPLTKGLAPNSERFHLGAEVKPLSPAALAALRPPPVAPTAPGSAAALPPTAGSAAAPPPPAGTKIEPAKPDATAAGRPALAPQPPIAPPASPSAAKTESPAGAATGKPASIAPAPPQPGKPETKAAQSPQASVQASPALPVPKAPEKPSATASPKSGSKP
jgi:general secretion pathway protein L